MKMWNLLSRELINTQLVRETIPTRIDTMARVEMQKKVLVRETIPRWMDIMARWEIQGRLQAV